MKLTTYHRPRTLAEACRLKHAHADARFLAGGTDLLVERGCSTPCPPTVISLRSIPELEGIEEADGGATRIGALTRIGDLVAHDRMREQYPVLVQAARRLGSPQIRNAATIGGNLCRAAPCADTAPPLLVLGARLRLQDAERTREVDLADFMLGPGATCLAPGELLTAILLDAPRPGARGAFLKKGRVHMDLSLASVAVLLEMEDDRCRRVRIAAGAAAPTPVRLEPVEALLEGEVITRRLVSEARDLAAKSVEPVTDVRTTEAYRRTITGVFVKRALEDLLGWSRA